MNRIFIADVYEIGIFNVGNMTIEFVAFDLNSGMGVNINIYYRLKA